MLRPLRTILWVLPWLALSCGEAPVVDDPPDAAPLGITETVPEAPDAEATQFPSADTHTQADLSYRIIDAPNGTFGYEVLSDGKLLIRQANIPGQPGTAGCRTKADAEKLAALVIDRIKAGIMPPTVDTDELRALNIIP